MIQGLEYWLALVRAPGIGPVNFARLIKHFGNPRSVLEAGFSEWQALALKIDVLNYLKTPDWSSVENDLRWLEHPNHHILTLEHPAYPSRLREIHDPPPVLFVCGDCQLLSTPQLAMIGSRHPSQQGETIALEFAQHLSKAGLTITSGLAMGIDTASHRGALEGNGETIAVVGTGLDRVYPAQNHELAHQIAEKGALVSEFLLGTPAKAINFPRRNRVISGISLGILVIEAASQSGSLITARHAADQGREVFAIPGSIHNPLTKGCHALIKEGAKLVETATDIIEELLLYLPATIPSHDDATTLTELPPHPPRWRTTLTETGTDLDETYQRLLEHLRNNPISVDHLVELSGLTAGEISSMLLILEMRGIVTSQAGGLYARTR
ncbi:MAG: DNA protecting protein DprA [Beggiatoa sp. IS2]|nr:MAG: DNA protecting protein DprA [Beggiatoa sp. IS2]